MALENDGRQVLDARPRLNSKFSFVGRDLASVRIPINISWIISGLVRSSLIDRLLRS